MGFAACGALAPPNASAASSAWSLLKLGGVIVFDDYAWGDANDLHRRPKTTEDGNSHF